MIRPFFPRPWQICAALDGRLTAVAVPLDPQPEPWKDYHLEGGCMTSDWSFEVGQYTEDGKRFKFGLWMHCRFHESRFQPLPFAPGDLLVCKEAWNIAFSADLAPGERFGKTAADCVRDNGGFGCACGEGLVYRDGGAVAHPVHGKALWRSPVTMPRWASRMTWGVSSVRVCRLWDMQLHEMYALGIPRPGGPILGSVVTETQNAKNKLFKHWTADNPDEIPLLDEDGRKIGMQPNPCAWERNPWIGFYRINVHLCNVKEIAA